MKITGFKRTVVCVPFLEEILSSDEEWHQRPAYPENLDRRRHDILRLQTDEDLVGLGMSAPYYGELKDPLEDRFRAMAEAAPGIRIVIDPKERFYTFEQTLALARRLEDLDIVFEDPFPRDFAAYRRLREETSVVVAMHLQRPGQVTQAIDTGAVDGINVAPSDWGFVDMARIAAAGDIPVWQASNVDLGLFDAYRVHTSAVAANCTMASDMCGNFVHEHSLLTEPLVRNGYATVPDGPGLGVELDEDAVYRCEVR